MDVRQCPRCELRFASLPELEDHISEAHPAPIDTDHPTSEPDTRQP